MNTGLLHLHSVLRYLVVIAALWAIFKSASGLSGTKPFTKKDQKPGLFFLIFMDLQLLVGVALYFLGAYGYKLIESLGADVMKDKITRFFAVEHVVGMLIAIILVHIGYANGKKNTLTDKKRYRKTFWFYLIAFIIIFVSIPWPFRNLGRGWFPGM